MTGTGDIARRRDAWIRQLQAQGLRPTHAARIAHAEADHEVTERQIRRAAADPARWYGPNSPEARQDQAGLAAEAEAAVAALRARFDAAQRQLLAHAAACGPGPQPATPQAAQPEATRHEPEAGL